MTSPTDTEVARLRGIIRKLVEAGARAQCIEGYECDYDGPDCRWIGLGGNDN